MNTQTSTNPFSSKASAVIQRLIGLNLEHRQRTEKQLLILEKQVDKLRLSKMLGKLGVPREGYFKYMTPKIIRGHISNCQRCSRSSSVRTCDAYLERGQRVKSMRFCPNYPSLIANSREFYCRDRKQ